MTPAPPRWELHPLKNDAFARRTVIQGIFWPKDPWMTPRPPSAPSPALRVDFEPLTVAVPLWEDPPGVVRVGKSRVLLELLLRAFKRGDTPEGIFRSFRTLPLADVYAVISRYLANPAPFDEYLGRCDEEAEAVRRELEAAGMTGGVSKEELLARARAKGLIP
jgi:hypothetical protein